jgi:hypothetical protein
MAVNKAIGNVTVPDPPHVVTASPTVGGPPQQDWDATSDATMSGWKAVDDGSGTADRSGNVTAAFPDGPGRWLQT